MSPMLPIEKDFSRWPKWDFPANPTATHPENTGFRSNPLTGFFATTVGILMVVALPTVVAIVLPIIDRLNLLPGGPLAQLSLRS